MRVFYGLMPMIRQSSLATTALIVMLCSGCGSDLRDIDARTQKLIQERTAAIGGGAVAPTPRSLQAAPGEDDPAITRKTIPTTNPAPEELRYAAAAPTAAEASEIEKRLAQSLDQPPDAGTIILDLKGSLQQSQKTAREYLRAEEDYIVAAIRLLVERHLWSPRLFNDTSLAASGVQTEGNVSSTLHLINELRATQKLPFGGEAAARWIWDATENLRSRVSGQYVQSSRLVFDASVPLMRGAGTVAQESLIQSERSLIYAAREFEAFRRTFLVSISHDYFALLQSRAAIENTRRQLKNVEQQEEEQLALFKAGRVAEFDVNRAANRVLSAQSALDAQVEQYILAVDRFKIRLGLPVDARVVIQPGAQGDLEIPLPAATPDEAIETALAYRLDLQNRRDQLDDAKRQVANARNQLLPDVTLAGNVTLPTDSATREGGVVFDPDDASYSATLTFSLPLDREIERLQLRQALISFEQSRRSFEQFRDELVVNVRFLRREIDRARDALRLAEEQVKITERRQIEQDLKRNIVTSRERLDTADELLAARNARDQALTDLRNAILQYLDAAGLLRVAREGTFIRLPGMDTAPPAPSGPEVPPPGGERVEPTTIQSRGVPSAPSRAPMVSSSDK